MPHPEGLTSKFATMLTCLLFIMLSPAHADAETARQMVQQAVQTELQADKNDHTEWLYFETDLKPNHAVKQWVAGTEKGSLERVIEENGRHTSPQEQHNKIESFIHDPGAQEKRREANENDDRESVRMLNLLPHAFIWTESAAQGEDETLHFKPDPSFRPPDTESRVFAVMEGNMTIDKDHHRIVSIQGRMMKGVKFLGGILGGLDPGGTFAVERRQTGHGEWQITETHVHIHGRVLFFKNISEQEDDVKSQFRELPQNITFRQAEDELMKQP
jgi:hypothetical protein